MADPALSGLELRSTVTRDGTLILRLEDVAAPDPDPDEVTVRVEASPINPSDLGLLIGPADLSSMTPSGTDDRPVLTCCIPPAAMPAMVARLDQSMPVGNEGAGTRNTALCPRRAASCCPMAPVRPTAHRCSSTR